ncbi:hypothetical protein MNBD_GAMMA21-2399 [hydrothermal vent metagenome]|uniref:PrcB C-terminal domain-containing protein n=1 Tax=hydrothermal vent metagenome TaxID=652676 RepID=A0A3B1AE20_9ZZZZ
MKYFYPKIFISLSLLFAVISCSSPPPTVVKTPSYSVISQGQQSGFTLQKVLIIESTGEFNELWAIHTGGSKTPTPIINFKSSVVVANFLGEQPTGGYSIKVNKVVYTEKYTQIIFSTHRPTPGSMRTMQITQPYIMIKIDKTKKPIYFEYNREN